MQPLVEASLVDSMGIDAHQGLDRCQKRQTALNRGHSKSFVPALRIPAEKENRMNALLHTLSALECAPLDTRRDLTAPALDESPGHSCIECGDVQHITLSNGEVLEAITFQMNPGDWRASDGEDERRHGHGTTRQDAVDMLVEIREQEIDEERAEAEYARGYDREAADVAYVDSLDAGDFR